MRWGTRESLREGDLNDSRFGGLILVCREWDGACALTGGL